MVYIIVYILAGVFVAIGMRWAAWSHEQFDPEKEGYSAWAITGGMLLIVLIWPVCALTILALAAKNKS